MKVFVIRDDEDINHKDLAFLIYYEREKKFYVELPEEANPWEVPLLLASFVKRGEYTVNAYWSKVWVQQRIVPQDSYYLVLLQEQELTEKFGARYQRKVEDVIPLEGSKLLVFFGDGNVRRYNMKIQLFKNAYFLAILKNDSLFKRVGVQTGGYGICWSAPDRILKTL